jgi:hypothetical protein
LEEDNLISSYYYDAYNFKPIEGLSEEDIINGDIIYINKEPIKVFSNNDFFLKETKDINSISIGYRVILEMCYQEAITNYGVENNDQNLI